MKGCIPKIAWLLRFQIEQRGAVASSNLRSVSAGGVSRSHQGNLTAHFPGGIWIPLYPTFFLSAPSLLFRRRVTEQHKPLYAPREISAIESEDQRRGPCSCHRRPRTEAPSLSNVLAHHPNNLLSVPCEPHVLGQWLLGASGARVVSGDSGSASAGGRTWG